MGSRSYPPMLPPGFALDQLNATQSRDLRGHGVFGTLALQMQIRVYERVQLG